ncbi:hypothetical protein AK830_g2825 [Neonectria ditissima]|uniref:Uncharacterized protein n=1 Tax=Neonectria ditissima TaxID=78410 RepID=A0A0P7BTS3_9HYPO|nr:hypothetical protein AK830_g2825 [Neonectria ditissima]
MAEKSPLLDMVMACMAAGNLLPIKHTTESKAVVTRNAQYSSDYDASCSSLGPEYGRHVLAGVLVTSRLRKETDETDWIGDEAAVNLRHARAEEAIMLEPSLVDHAPLASLKSA